MSAALVAYEEAGTCKIPVQIENAHGFFYSPGRAEPGQTIHLILEVIDDGVRVDPFREGDCHGCIILKSDRNEKKRIYQEYISAGLGNPVTLIGLGGIKKGKSGRPTSGSADRAALICGLLPLILLWR